MDERGLIRSFLQYWQPDHDHLRQRLHGAITHVPTSVKNQTAAFEDLINYFEGTMTRDWVTFSRVSREIHKLVHALIFVEFFHNEPSVLETLWAIPWNWHFRKVCTSKSQWPTICFPQNSRWFQRTSLMLVLVRYATCPWQKLYTPRLALRSAWRYGCTMTPEMDKR